MLVNKSEISKKKEEVNILLTRIKFCPFMATRKIIMGMTQGCGSFHV